MTVQITLYRIRLNDEIIRLPERISRERDITRPLFVRNYVVTDEQDFGLCPPFRQRRNRPKTWGKERHPVFENKQIGLPSADFPCNGEPIQRVDGVDEFRR